MTISLIAAVTSGLAIGKNNDLLFKIPEDLRYFKEKTWHKAVLMGRKTYESIGRPLPGRINAILSRDRSFRPKGVIVYESVDEALTMLPRLIKEFGYDDEIMVIGGSNVYNRLIHKADTLYITEIHAYVNGDAYFPIVNRTWSETGRVKGRGEEGFPDYDFVTYTR